MGVSMDVLSDEQRRVVDHPAGVLKVVGPARSGKTTALIERAARLVADGADPAGILFFAGDRRQAIRLRDVLVRRLGRSVAGPSVLTFHAFAWSLLRRPFAVTTSGGLESDVGFQLVGLPDEPVLLTAFDQRAFVRSMLAEEDPVDWPVNGALLGSNAFAGEVRDFLLRVQERLLEPGDVVALAKRLGREDWPELAAFSKRYRDRLFDETAFEDRRPRLDFANVLLEARRLVVEHPEVAADLRAIYPHLLVDDFEEANRAERSLLETLLPVAGEQRSAVVAGDPGGSVYAFRGADPANLTELACDDSLTIAEPLVRAEEPRVLLYSYVTDEAKGVVAEVRQAHASGTPWGDIAVILRDYRQLGASLRRELKRAGVPFRIEGESQQLATDPVVRPILDLFSVACRRPGHEELWPALLTSEIGGFSAIELIELRRAARLADLELHRLCSGAPVELAPRLQAKLGHLCELIDRACAWASDLAAEDCFWELWRTAPYFEDIVRREDERRLDSLTTLADALSRFTERRGRDARIADFLETLESAEFTPESVRLDRAGDSVTLTTVHSAKGMSFGFAVIAGCSEGIWPDPSRRGVLLDTDLLRGLSGFGDRRRAALEEEERLFRLAVTRSDRIVVTGQSAGGSDRTSAEPSRFIQLVVPELPEDNARIPELILSAPEAEIAWRRRAADPDEAPAVRLASVWGLANLDIDPDRWWWGRTWTESDQPVAPEGKRTSYSRYSSYENCPLQYLMGQVLGLDPDTTYQMAYGSLIHSLLEDLEAGKLEPELDVLMAEAERRWRDDAFPRGAISAYLKRDMGEILSRFLAKELGDGHEVLRLEESFEFDVAGWTIRGRIDRIDKLQNDGLRLVDYKTSNSWKTDKQVEDDLQLATYFLACTRAENLKGLGTPKMAELVFLRHEMRGKIRRAVQFPGQGPEGEPWETVTEQRIAGILEGIEAETFAPSPEAECRFCKFRPLCPMWPEGEEVKVR